MTLHSCFSCKTKFRMNLVLKRLNKNNDNTLCIKCSKKSNTKQPKKIQRRKVQKKRRHTEQEILKTEIIKNDPCIVEAINCWIDYTTERI